jgi:hypothetical protein
MMDEPLTIRTKMKKEVSEVQELKKFSIAELVAGALLILAIATHSYSLSARVVVLETKEEARQAQLDRIEHNVDYLVRREIEKTNSASPK